MRTNQPKKNLTKVAKYDNRPYGREVRLDYQNTILEKAPIFPKPLTYEDIDKAVFDFVDKDVDITINGKLIPTFTLYSNQRFSEYSQMWEHSDENGNLYLDFKTINRDSSPSYGNNQGGYWNIPGKRDYTLLQREVIDDNGVECYELYTMKQPYTVDLTYTLTFITTMFENVNQFNQKINKLFAAKQFYIRPNGHYIPLTVDDITDQTSYSITDRKFFVQAVTLKLLAYIIEEEDFNVKKYPKRQNISSHGEKFMKKKPCIEIDEFDADNPYDTKKLTLSIKFQPMNLKVEFIFDTDMVIDTIETENIRNYRLFVNGTMFYTEKGFKLKPDDEVLIKINPLELDKESSILFKGYDPNTLIDTSEMFVERKDENLFVE